MKKLKKIFATILTAAIFFGAQVYANESWQPEIRLGILSGVQSVNLQISKPCVLIDSESRKILKKINAGENFSVSFSNLKSNAVEIRSEDFPLKDLIVTVNDKKYFGGVRVNKNKNSLTVINLAPVEEYLRGVVPNEMSPSFNAEALKAQAVAARSFTLKNRNRHNSEGFDLCATTHCQIFGGADSATNFTDEIIKSTRGEVLVLNGRIVDTNFHTDSGGMTESVENVWGGYASHLQPVEELEKNTQPWTKEFTIEDFSSRFGADFGKLAAFRLSPLKIGRSDVDRSTSGRVKSVQLIGSKKNLQLTGNELRQKFSLPSTLFDIKISGSKIIFEGYGSGHGVGMSQNGANAYAKSGWTYDKILYHYYRGTEIRKLY
ncbi:MAG: SpoIID/LytB domain-containing protein [Selenomonadaceae bacterium]|nr:SpoIID/LytB domain-containing protein [Selenomonadaceae bacterium]